MDAATLIKQMRERREAWIDLEPAKPGVPAKRVKVRRPAEAELTAYSRATSLEDAAQRVVAWEGFAESDLMDPGVGGSDIVPFDADLWKELVSDRLDWMRKVSEKLHEMVTAHKLSIDAAAKN